MKTKIRSYSGNSTDFYSRGTPGSSLQLYLLVGNINCSVLKKDENYDPQVFLKEYKPIEKEKRWLNILPMT